MNPENLLKKFGYFSLLCILSSGCSDSGPTEPVVPEDTTPPVISNYSENVTYNEANLSWETDEEARIEVDYLGDSKPEISDSAYRKTYSAHLTDLVPEKTYNITIKVYDRAGNVTEKKITFTTLPPPDTTAPTISNLTLEISEDGAEDPFIKIKYVTDEPSVDSIYVENAGKMYPLGETTSKAAHSFTFSDPAADSVNIKLVAIDEAGNSTRKDTSAVLDAAMRYGLILRGPRNHDWATNDSDALKNFLEQRSYETVLLHLPSEAEIKTAIDDIKDKTDENDEIVFNITCHGVFGGIGGNGEIGIYSNGRDTPAEEVTDNWNNDDYGRLTFLPLISYGKAIVDRTSMPRSVSMTHVWDDESPASYFFNNYYFSPAVGVIPEITRNPSATVRELFTELYTDFATSTLHYHPFLGIKGDPAEPPGEYQAYSDKDGVIHGYSELLDRRAFRIPELSEE